MNRYRRVTTGFCNPAIFHTCLHLGVDIDTILETPKQLVPDLCVNTRSQHQAVERGAKLIEPTVDILPWDLRLQHGTMAEQ